VSFNQLSSEERESLERKHLERKHVSFNQLSSARVRRGSICEGASVFQPDLLRGEGASAP
jgi:hypothetical protein